MNFDLIRVDNRYGLGEKADIRRVNVEDPDEIQRLMRIENDPQVIEFMEGLQSTDEDLKSFGTGDPDRLTIAISGKEGFVDGDEVGKLQGWIYFNPDEEERLTRLKLNGVGGEWIQTRQVTEISYAKYPGAAKGQMSSGLRQIIKILEEECRKYSEKLVVTAYTDKINFDSKRLLEAGNFVKVGEIGYHPDSLRNDDVWMLPIN